MENNHLRIMKIIQNAECCNFEINKLFLYNLMRNMKYFQLNDYYGFYKIQSIITKIKSFLLFFYVSIGIFI